MNRNFTLLFLLVLVFPSCQKELNNFKSQTKQNYTSPNRDGAFIEKVAVIQSKIGDNSQEIFVDDSSLLQPGYLQRQLFKELAKKVTNGKLNVRIQSFLESNAKLRRHRFYYSNLSRANRIYIGNALGVDGLVVCEFNDGVNETGRIDNQKELERISEIVFYVSIYDVRNGRLVWREKAESTLNNYRGQLESLAVDKIELILKELPGKIEQSQGLEEISLL